MMELFQDSSFWVLLSFILFAFIAIKYGKDTALGMLDGKIDAIKTELAVAEKLRVEAQELLAEYQRKHKDAMAEANEIVAQAKSHAEKMRLQAESNLEESMKRRELQLQERLDAIERKASQDIQAYTAKIAINAARDLMSEKMDSKQDKSIIDNGLKTVSKTLN
jgi:F-type H+-transporting ATPase subunit b